MIPNVGKLAGKTVFITGASRGIGKAIAEKCAKDGANIVIAAKTATPHPKLPGTIYTAAEELEQLGGKCLPCEVDIRDEKQVKQAIDSAVSKFGGIDILVNNASAISLTNTEATEMKRFDLMFGVNVRGTFLCSKYCIPHLKRAKNPKILNISPPLSLNPVWFKDHCAYTMSKFGMSMCVLGMADELKGDHICVNALWPKTAIYTAAMEMLAGSKEVMARCRKPEVMSDAAYVILTNDSPDNTGHFYVDENVLKDANITNFDKYNFVENPSLMPDFFLEEYLNDKHAFQISNADKKVESENKSEDLIKSNPELARTLDALRQIITKDVVDAVGSVYVFQIEEYGSILLDLKNESGSLLLQAPDGLTPDSTFILNAETFVQMFNRQLAPAAAFMTGRLEIDGDFAKAMKLEKAMKGLKSNL
ncbi:hypothetical protein HELRODRAFT_185726 [Helobdella robusta]|uniref:Hydroxysteroid dehydrogenase-like protein 2 n=1 Tax=Helobdella robusta TaxID=6412 RepID=T1FN73_HELRO|nr:hypothetical protein HELRODRAFT_185726 [Helobdella robusta]ESO01019.1 hypothetical protein HELRODRAFT_185726 [Helobdella robusta]